MLDQSFESFTPIKGQVCSDLFEVTLSRMSIIHAFYHSFWMYPQ
jgi:hypothetical protein